MSQTVMTLEEKKALTSARQRAVRNAWKNEQELVRNGKGTRDWTLDEQEELLETGSVDGYEGHHMKSVSLYPEYAGDAENIQFLSTDEHLYGAHQGSYHNATNGYYDPETQTMNSFVGSELEPVEVRDLSESCVETEANDYIGSAEEGPESAGGEDYVGDLESAPSGEAVQEQGAEVGGESSEAGYGVD